jgi:hypothetical protein
MDTVIASLDGTRLSLAGLLRWLRARGRLGPLVREALAAQLVQEQARQAGLSATAEELGKLAQALHPGDEEAAEGRGAEWCHRLKHEGGAAVLEGLGGLAVRGRSARECLREVVTYFTNQRHRMDYPAYRAKGWQIGSGQVESACKAVVGQRLKGAGMRWGEDGADAVCHVRALFRSEPGQWEAFWSCN